MADEKGAAEAEDVAAFEGCGRGEADDLAIPGERWLDAGGFGAARGGSQRTQNGDFVEDNSRVLDEGTVGQVAIHVKRYDVGAAGAESGTVGVMLRSSQFVIDGSGRDERAHAGLHVGGWGVREGDHGKGN
jgi:hypothetical protein